LALAKTQGKSSCSSVAPSSISRSKTWSWVHLVDDHDGPEAQRQCLAGHELGLGHGAVEGVHHQQDGIHHAQHPFDFAAKVGMAGGVHDIEPVAAPVQGGRLGQDGDAPLTLLVIAVHGPFLDPLVVPEHVGPLEQGVHEGGLAVIDVGDDGKVADLLERGHQDSWLGAVRKNQ
jgi:hypothetical protein